MPADDLERRASADLDYSQLPTDEVVQHFIMALERDPLAVLEASRAVNAEVSKRGLSEDLIQDVWDEMARSPYPSPG